MLLALVKMSRPVNIVIAMVTLIRSEDKFKIKKGNGKYIFLRCLFGTTGLLCNFYAIDHLPLADSNMLNKLSPFFAIIASIPILKEKPTKVDITTTGFRITNRYQIVLIHQVY